MVNGNNKSHAANSLAGSAPAPAGVSVPVLQAGNGSNPSGNAGSGGTQASASSSGVIPGSASKAKGGPRVEITQIVNGLGSQFPSGSETLLVKGQALTVSSLIATLSVVLGLFAAVDGSRQSLKSQQLALKAALPDARSLTAAIRVALVALFGKGNPVLQSFGINVSQRKKLTSEQLLAKKQKARATRKLRGTLGSRQKADVKFVGTVQVQTEVSGVQAAGGNATPTGSTGASPSAGSPAAGTGASKP